MPRCPQGGSNSDDSFRAVDGSSNDTVVFAGFTEGSWSADNGFIEASLSEDNVGAQDFAAVRALASFSETPTIASPSEEDQEPGPGSGSGSESEESEKSDNPQHPVLVGRLVVLSMFAVFGGLAYRARKRWAQESNATLGESSVSRRRRPSAVELDAWARARRAARDVGDDDAAPVNRFTGSSTLERSGGVGAESQEGGAGRDHQLERMGNAVLAQEGGAWSGDLGYVVGDAVLAQEVGGIGSGSEVERNSGDGVADTQGGSVPYAHAVAIPPTSDVDGSGRAWTVVTAEVVER